ncbi:MAG: nucleotidyltransferase substrate binding protein [Truepera sp.]|nr:nucleotidyltransferase substrate binding protein [Truepera sp.]
MGHQEEIRWVFTKALSRLREAVELAHRRPLTDLEEQGLIQAFEFTHELAWNTVKDFLASRGVSGLYGSKDTTREAFRQGLIANGEAWMEMIRSRNLTSHTYNEEVAKAIAGAISNDYFVEFERLLEVLTDLKSGEAV